MNQMLLFIVLLLIVLGVYKCSHKAIMIVSLVVEGFATVVMGNFSKGSKLFKKAYVKLKRYIDVESVTLPEIKADFSLQIFLKCF